MADDTEAVDYSKWLAVNKIIHGNGSDDPTIVNPDEPVGSGWDQEQLEEWARIGVIVEPNAATAAATDENERLKAEIARLQEELSAAKGENPDNTSGDSSVAGSGGLSSTDPKAGNKTPNLP